MSIHHHHSSGTTLEWRFEDTHRETTKWHTGLLAGTKNTFSKSKYHHWLMLLLELVYVKAFKHNISSFSLLAISEITWNNCIFPHISRYFLKSPANHSKPKFKTNNGPIFPHISRHFLKSKALANYSKPKFKTNNGPTFPHISRHFLPPKRKNSRRVLLFININIVLLI